MMTLIARLGAPRRLQNLDRKMSQSDRQIIALAAALLLPGVPDHGQTDRPLH
jgi:hypothetical protein